MTYDIVDIMCNAVSDGFKTQPPVNWWLGFEVAPAEVWSQFGGWYLQWLNIVVS